MKTEEKKTKPLCNNNNISGGFCFLTSQAMKNLVKKNNNHNNFSSFPPFSHQLKTKNECYTIKDQPLTEHKGKKRAWNP